MIIKKYKRWSSINYLIFPGFTDTEHEFKALCNVIRKVDLKMIQTRNLNIDPLWYIKKAKLDADHGDVIGIRAWVKRIRNEFPTLLLGYFNPPLGVMKSVTDK
jgi:hypothetical protein